MPDEIKVTIEASGEVTKGPGKPQQDEEQDECPQQ